MANDGGPAFPVQDVGTHGTFGMSLRDWFAGQAMQGMCAHPDTWGLTKFGIAEMAYNVADAMLAARKGATDGNQ